VTKSDPEEYLPTSVQKSYFMLSRSACAVLDIALRKYRLGRTDLISVGGIAQLKLPGLATFPINRIAQLTPVTWAKSATGPLRSIPRHIRRDCNTKARNRPSPQ
jgi:hypothetical protein